MDGIRRKEYVLRPGNYVDPEEAERDVAPFNERIANARAQLDAQFSESTSLNNAIIEALSSYRFTSADEKAPEGWHERSLDEIATFLNGLALQKYPPTAGDSLPVIKIAQLRAGHTQDADLASARMPLCPPSSGDSGFRKALVSDGRIRAIENRTDSRAVFRDKRGLGRDILDGHILIIRKTGTQERR